MAGFCGPNVWSVWYNWEKVELSHCFQETVLLPLPAYFLILFTILRTALRWKHLFRPHHNATPALGWIKLGWAVATFIVRLVHLILVLGSSFLYPAAALAAAMNLLAAFLYVPLTYFEHRTARLPSMLLVLWSFLGILMDAMYVRSLGMHDFHTTHTDMFVTQVLCLTAYVGTCLLESLPKLAFPKTTARGLAYPPEGSAGPWSIFFFHWLTDMMRLGHQKKDLEMDDCWDLKEKDESGYLARLFQRHWSKEQASGDPSLMRAIFHTVGWQFLSAAVFKLAQDLLSFVQPKLLAAMLTFATTRMQGADPAQALPVAHGVIVAFAMFACALVQSIMLHQYFHICLLTGMRLRAALVTAIYQKALRLSAKSRHKFTVGEIVNHMAVDAQKLMDLTTYLHIIWSGPEQIAVALVLLYQTLGVSVFAGLAVMICMIPLSGLTGTWQRRLQKKQMVNKDSRIKLMDEILAGMKVIKLYAWENAFVQRILAVRERELGILKRIAGIQAFQALTWSAAPFFVSMATFGVYVAVEAAPLTSSKIFVSLSLFNLLQFPLSMFPSVITSVVESTVSVTRIRNFLASEELDPTAVAALPAADGGPAAPAVEFAGPASFAWDQDVVLHDLAFSIPKGSLTAIIGRVGTGKSSLLSAVLGDMVKQAGSVTVRGQSVYVAQTAWIMNATVQENILFGKPLDPDRYRRTVAACALLTDLEILPAGDLTEIGEKGINLSGGQKQRISLARAVYADADLYLMDDPLSAVDANVSAHIFKHVLSNDGGMLAGKTRLLVTHAIHYLPQCTQVVLMEGGRVGLLGSYHDMLEAEGPLAQIFRDLMDQERRKAAKRAAGLDASTDSTLEKSGPGGAGADAAGADAGADAASLPQAPLSGSLAAPAAAPVSAPATAAPPADLKKDAAKGSKLIEKETSKAGAVEWQVYMTYAQACGYLSVLFLITIMFLSAGVSVGQNVWLSVWSDDNDQAVLNGTEPAVSVGLRLGIYAVFGVVYCIMVVAQVLLVWTLCGIAAARVLHKDMLERIMRCPQSFFDITPLGRIVNRFSKDTQIVDDTLPRSFQQYFRTMFQVVSAVVVNAVYTPLFLALAVPVFIAYYFIQRYYIHSSRSLKRLDSVTRSPIYAHFSETIGGVATIRAYGDAPRFTRHNEKVLNDNQRAYYPSMASNRWLAMRLEVLGALIIFASAIFGVVQMVIRGYADPSSMGLTISYTLSITQALNWMVRMYCEIETNVVAVERIREYALLPTEEPYYGPDAGGAAPGAAAPPSPALQYRADVKTAADVRYSGLATTALHGGDGRPALPPDMLPTPPDWPAQGVVRFKDYAARYRPGLPLVLDDISLATSPAEKLGLVGRTGSGKSSLALGLFRLIEPAEGTILIDGVDITKLGLRDLRSRLTIIPQDPILFQGTVRDNLDPFRARDDAELWGALGDAHLADFVRTLPSQLDAAVLQNGENFSMGQRQLMCLARAILRKTKVLVLDEATASVDMETDRLIQETIRRSFRDCTILTVAHRIQTIMDNDRILVLQQGRVMELDTPAALMDQPASLFAQLANQDH